MTDSSRRKEVDMKKVFMIIAIAAILVGCKGKGTRVQISDSVDKFKVEKLFVVDSITVYRFYDQGNAIYFTNRKGRVDAIHSKYNPVTRTYNDEELIGHLQSYISFVGKDCEMLVFDKAEGVSCDINETTSDGDYVFLHISSDKYTTKTPE